MDLHPTEELLRTLGYRDDDLIVMAVKDPQFRGVPVVGPAAAARLASESNCDVWLTVNAMREFKDGRGKASDVIRVTALWADLDFKPSGVIDEAGGLALIERLSKWMGYEPAAVVYSGGGLQPYWLVKQGIDIEHGRVTLLRWRSLVEREAAALGFHVDPVFDLPRVMRAPGSRNYKGSEPRDVTLTLGASLDAQTLDDIADILSDAGIVTPGSSATAEPVERATTEGWLTEGEPCRAALDILEWWDSARGSDLHGSTLTAIGRLLRAGEQGHIGIGNAINALWGAFDVAAASGGSSGRVRSGSERVVEWRDMFRQDIIDQIGASPTAPEDRGCCGVHAARHDDDLLGATLIKSDDSLWGQSEILGHIRQAALSDCVSPIAVLAGYLVIISTAAGTAYRLEGGSSLNTLVVIVGGSGSGKSRAWEVAKGLSPDAVTHCWRQGPGSGEGLIDAFLLPPTKDDPTPGRTMGRDRVLVYADEAAQMFSQNGRQGSTFMSILRSMAVGAEVGNSNSTAGGRTRWLDTNTYRLGMIMGIQASQAGPLLTADEIASGTPQRLFWVNTGRDAIEVRPTHPGTLPWTAPNRGPLNGALEALVAPPADILVEYPDFIRDEIWRARAREVDPWGEGDLAAHRNLLRLKLATDLAMIHGRYGSFNEEHWKWAGLLSAHSDSTQAECQRVIGRASDAREESAGRREAVRERGKMNAKTERAQDAFANMIVKHHEAERHPGLGCNKKCFNALNTHRSAEIRDPALALGVESGRFTYSDGRWSISTD